MFYKTFTGVDFSREIFFRHTTIFFSCVAFFVSRHSRKVFDERRKVYGTNIYEREKNCALSDFNVAANGDFHGGEFPVQYY